MTAQDRPRLFFVLSGEHHSLPRAEVLAILEAEGIPCRILSSEFRLITVESSLEALAVVGARSLMVESCGLIVSEANTEQFSVDEMLDPSRLSSFLNEGETFAVRSVRLGGVERGLRREQLEKDIGETILRMKKGVRVDLRRPGKTFLAVISTGKVILGVVTNVRERGVIARRRPRKRPCFHPSTMPPKLARCMVNLARARSGQVLLDPFCGVGGHLIEAGLIGCRVIGADVKRKMIAGALKNLSYFDVKPEGLLLADARRMPFREVNSIATDPPYGRGASTIGTAPGNMLGAFLSEVPNILRRGSHVCLAAPTELDATTLAKRAGFKVLECYDIYVHRSLTRQVLVLRLT
jgi:tRNA (guanine10-N2)-dimethyltransferase